LILLDTHVWVWWLNDPAKLPSGAGKVVKEAAKSRALYISSISTWEVALLASKGRLTFTAITMGMPVVSSDKQDPEIPHVKTIWK